MSTTNFTFDTNADKKQSKKILKIVIILVVALLILSGLGLFGLVKLRDRNRIFYTPANSMAPTVVTQDRVRTAKLSSDAEVKRGWVVVFDRPSTELAGDPSVTKLIKRVVGVPGDTIEARDGVVYLNGAALEEPYLAPGTGTAALPKTVMQEDQYFVLGDNRPDSLDSRRFGPISRGSITNHATNVIYPAGHRKKL